MDTFNLILKSIISSFPFVIIVIAFIVGRSICLMKKRNARFPDWLMKEDGEEILRLLAIERKRCPDCGNPFTETCPLQKCRKCGYELMGTEREAEAYLNFMHRRYIRQVTPVCVLLSFIPLIGFIIGILYLRSVIVAPFAQYLPFGRRFKTIWTLRLFVGILAVFQILPGYGAVSVPLVAYIKYWFFSSAYLEALEKAGAYGRCGTNKM